MEDSSNSNPQGSPSRRGVTVFGVGLLVIVLGLFLLGKTTDLFNVEALQQGLEHFANGPWGVPALILTFIACAFIGVPQFVLIGIAVYAFGPIWGAVWSWVASLCSGTLTFWIGRFAGKRLLARFSAPRIKRFTAFIARNAFAASAIVRNVPTGPFLIVNMMFGAVGSSYLAYLAGMGLGIIPKILLIAFGLQAIQAALEGQIWLAILAALAALAVFLGGYFYVRHRRRKGDNIAFNGD